MIECKNFVFGEFQSAGGVVQTVKSPWTGKVIGSFRNSTPDDINAALVHAESAFQKWSKLTSKDRSSYLFSLRTILIRDLEKISQTISLESGKTLSEAKAGLLKGIEVLEFACSIQNLDSLGKIQVSKGVYCEYRREALGVVLGITPFNFPAMVPFWMIPIALAMGNAFVWKPSDKVPLTSNLISEAISEAGFPKGVFTVIQGNQEVAQNLIEHHLIQAIAFVGSSPIAKSIYAKGSSLGKKVLALGGAKNPIILMPDADVEIASRGIADSFTGCAGQRCMAASVLLVIEDEKKRSQVIIEKIIEKAKQIVVGKDMGAIISAESLLKLQNAIESAKSENSKILLDGRVISNLKDSKVNEGGNWLGPTIIDEVRIDSNLAKTELFGPILSIVRVKNLTEALEFESLSSYGNACSVFTQDGSIAERVANESTAGMIGINVGVPVPREPFSFGGTKESKFGQGDITGLGGIEFWSKLKKVTTKWSESTDKNWMS